MSKQQIVAGVEPMRIWAWIQPPASTSAAVAFPAKGQNADRWNSAERHDRRDPGPAVAGSEDPIEPWRRMQERLEPLLSAPEQQGNFPARMEALAVDILQRVESDPDLAIMAMVRLDFYDYAVAHALQTAVICDVYGHSTGAPLEQRLVLIQAALTMNIAMVELQRELEWQSVPPSPEQRRQIYEHPQRGRERLEALGVKNEAWLRAVAEHHETPDGSGYPTGLLSTSSDADLLAVADRYCALLSRRGARDAMPGNRAAQTLCSLVHAKRQPLAARIIEIFGQHPPGSLVRLVNGEIAIVIRRGNTTQPEQVCALASIGGEPLPVPVLRDTCQPVYVIVGSVSDRDFKGMIDYLALRNVVG